MSIRSSHKKLSNILDRFLNISGLGFYFQQPNRILYLPDSSHDQHSNHCYNCIEPLYNIHNMLSTYTRVFIMIPLFFVALDLSRTVATQPEVNDDPRTVQEIEWATDIRWDISKGYD